MDATEKKTSPARRKRVLRWAEWFFWIAGAVLLGSYVYVYVNRAAYQAYEEWAFDRKLKHEPAPVIGFLLHSLHAGKQPPPPPKSQDEKQVIIAPPPTLAPSQPPIEPPRPPAEPLQPGSVIGRLEIPRLGLRVMVLESTDNKTLRLAAGHIIGTALPGQKGNIGIAGHRDTMFRPLRDIKKDDTIELTTLDGTYCYRVVSTEIVKPNDTSVLNNTGAETLTLVTCYPFYYVGSAPKRFIVQARAITPQPPPGS